MDLLHTKEEAKHFNDLYLLACELDKLSKRYENKELEELSNKYKTLINNELDKYQSFVDIECTSPPSWVVKTAEERRLGKIEGKFYFNQSTVRCTFRYSRNTGGGFDTHDIKELIRVD